MNPHHKRKISGNKRSLPTRSGLDKQPCPAKPRGEAGSMSAVGRSGHPTHSSPDPDDTDNPFNPPVKL